MKNKPNPALSYVFNEIKKDKKIKFCEIIPITAPMNLPGHTVKCLFFE
jgi:hypothetical protein